MTDVEARNTEIINMHLAGLDPRAIAAEMDVSEGTVRKVIKESGVEAQARESGLPTVAITEKYTSDVQVSEILREFGITYTQLYRILAEENVPIRKVANADARARQLDEAVALYEQGVPIHQIVSDTGINQPTLHAELHKREVPLRRPRK